ncbi:MAG: 1-deoxy-D-xylulose-5-phosphate synthase [Eubacteriales bacterium]|nr:1-deoxy-D-xylulose-5-phosphate synthase [Eubacteriales bacterium]
MLESINSPEDLKKLTYPELDQLASEIREYLINTVSVTGGHLASNLGTVELSIALNRVYDASTDRIVFDVGHQAYTHKIINGRREQLTTLRQFGGISGFPKPYESDADAFIAGHSSDSISVAYGMARARTLMHGNYNVCALIGDGALTGGLAYEGLENVASSSEPIVIILNDNNMSINRNVGGLSRMLKKLRTSESYYEFKRKYRAVIGINSFAYKFSHSIKELIKEHALAGNMFTALGLNYLGPIDGHDISSLEEAIRVARDMRQPVLLHVITQKGKGYKFAELHPDKFHGIGPFNKETGEPNSSSKGYCNVMGEELCALAEKNDRIVALTAAMSGGTGLTGFEEKYPNRFFDVGICEGHAVSMAAGMAKQGMVPVFAVYSSFLQRAYDMLIHDISLLNLHVVFCVDRCGIVGSDGETHNGSFDVAFLSSVPGMKILSPASFIELKAMLRYAVNDCSGPVAIRYPRGGEGEYKNVYVSEEQLLRSGKDLTMVCYGTLTSNIVKASEELEKMDISAEVIKLGIISPNSFEKTLNSLVRTRKLLIAEDVCSEDCIGRRILSEAESRGIRIKTSCLLNLGSGLISHGSVPQLYKFAGMDSESIIKQAVRITEE